MSSTERAKSRWPAVAAVAAIAAGIRIAWVLVASRTPKGLSDPAIYLHAASSIAAGDGYRSLLGEPTAYYPPGYPFFVGAVQWVLDGIGLGGHLVLVLGLIQALLGGVAAGALVVAGDRLTPDSRRVGVIAGLLFACWPNLVMHAPLVLSESLFLAAVCVLIAALVVCTSSPSGVERNRHDAWVAAAVVVSACVSTWVRPQSVLLVAPAAVVVWLVGDGWRRALRLALPLVAGLVLAVLPWAIRNAVVMDAFVPMSTNTGDNLCIGFHDGATGGFVQDAACATDGRYVDGPEVEVERDGELRRRAQDWIVANPTSVPLLSWHKLERTFAHDTDAVAAWESYGEDPHLSPGVRSALRWASDLYYWAVGIVSVVGVAWVLADAVRSRRTRPWSTALTSSVLVVAVWTTGWIVPVLFFGDERFKVPMVPATCLLAALALQRLLDRRGSDGETSGAGPDAGPADDVRSRPDDAGVGATDVDRVGGAR